MALASLLFVTFGGKKEETLRYISERGRKYISSKKKRMRSSDIDDTDTIDKDVFFGYTR